MSQQLTDYQRYLYGYQEEKAKPKLRLTPKGEFIVRMRCWLMDYASEGEANRLAVELAEKLWDTEGRLKKDGPA